MFRLGKYNSRRLVPFFPALVSSCYGKRKVYFLVIWGVYLWRVFDGAYFFFGLVYVRYLFLSGSVHVFGWREIVLFYLYKSFGPEVICFYCHLIHCPRCVKLVKLSTLTNHKGTLKVIASLRQEEIRLVNCSFYF